MTDARDRRPETRNKAKKTGRNAPCPCNSGRKYKHCCGSVADQSFSIIPPAATDAKLLRQRLDAAEHQRRQQQGLGKPIIAAEMKGMRFVAVANKLYCSTKWKTFHDFLWGYALLVLGRDWANTEMQKPLSQQHTALVWYHYACSHSRGFAAEPGTVRSASMTGAVAAWLHLAYDLYSLAHNVGVRDKLVNRMRDMQGFPGARYEVYVAADLIRAGFEIEFENEDDRRSTHCEFTATCKASGRKYSVEAKHRNPTDQTGSGTFRLGRRLHRALRKAALHPRVVFIDVNVPERATGRSIPAFLRRSLAEMRRFEGRLLNGQPLPDAYIFVTNHPYEHNLHGTEFRDAALAEGFQIPSFKADTAFPSLRAAIDAHRTHADMHQLWGSIREHSTIPSTFDGTPSELAFGEHPPRFLIGEFYAVPDGQGREPRGRLASAFVDEQKGVVYGVYSLDDGRAILATSELTPAEIAAYQRHPDTFFGIHLPVSRPVESLLGLFDVLYDTYRHTHREKLLGWLQNAHDIEELKNKSQEELAITYAERCASVEWSRTTPHRGH